MLSATKLLFDSSAQEDDEAIAMAQAMPPSDEDDDFQHPIEVASLVQKRILTSCENTAKKNKKKSNSEPLKPTNGGSHSTKRPKPSTAKGKENSGSNPTSVSPIFDFKFTSSNSSCGDKMGNGYASMSIEASLLKSRTNQNGVASSGIETGVFESRGCLEESCDDSFEPGSQLNSLMNLCFKEEIAGEDAGATDVDEACFQYRNGGDIEDLMWEKSSLERIEEGIAGEGISLGGLEEVVECPLCGSDISDLSEELRQVHSNGCLDKDEVQKVTIPTDETRDRSPRHLVDVTPVLDWLRTLGLSKYEDAFIREEVDWDTLQWLTEEDLLSLGVTALGPRKKIVHALNELKGRNMHAHAVHSDASTTTTDENKRIGSGNKLITEYFQGPFADKNQNNVALKSRQGLEIGNMASGRKTTKTRNRVRVGNLGDIPPWSCIPGTPFRVDAFRYLRGDCSHWFLTHFHLDHYQGLTRGFCHGKIYCSSITARLVNMKIGIPCDKLQVLPLNQKIDIGGINVTCLDANHCPGSIIILFEPPNGKAVLHTGDFRFCDEMLSSPILESCPIHTLILDTTYCNPQYDFPKQEAVIQFVIEAIQAEAFNPRTLFLIGSYTIGKERLFLEVARFLRKKVYVGLVKLRLVQCLGLPEEDMQWFTSNELESQIHVVPMWMIASFKRMKYISNRYSDRYNLIVAFSPTGWSFGKGKKKSPGRRSQQGTIIRYEVPYSEHCSFTELREFVRFISPENIIPSVNNSGPESADAMVAQLLSSDT